MRLARREVGRMDKLIIRVDDDTAQRPRVKRVSVYTERYEQICDLCDVTHLRQEVLMDKLLRFALERTELATEDGDG